MVNSAEIRTCLTALEKAEADLAALKAFEAAGGRFRLKLGVDHSDPNISDIISRLEQENLAKSGMLPGIMKWAETDVDEAREALRSAISGGEVDEPSGKTKLLSELGEAMMNSPPIVVEKGVPFPLKPGQVVVTR